MELLGALSVLQPAGIVALAERSLMVQAVLFMLIVVVPVYALLFFFAYYYRAGNKKATYLPNWQHAKVDELIWWAIPFEIVLILGALTWSSTHELDPKKPLVSDVAPLVVQVVALEWKWLFVYPEQQIATVNFLALPIDRPVRFEITADAPMNSFWIPKLGGQIYAMTGMVTTLNLMASEEGTFSGVSANYSGDGFADMQFSVHVLSEEDFYSWSKGLSTQQPLTIEEYQRLSQPSTGDDVFYKGVAENLFDSVVMKFSGAHAH